MTQARTKPKRKRTWPNVYTRTHRGGQASYVVDLGIVEGNRERHSFKTKEEADTFAAAKRTERMNQGVAAVTLPSATRNDALKASNLLAPYGASLEDAAKHYVKHVLIYRNAPVVEEIVKRLLADAEKNARRERTLGDLRYRLETFSEEFEGKKLGELTLDDLKRWLDENEDWSPRSKINFITKISQLYNYAIKHGWADRNLVERLDRPQTEDKTPGIFTVAQARALLKNAQAHDLLPYISLGLFAGLRSAELERLQSDAVRLADHSIIIGPEVAKKRSRRVVDICDALHAYLVKFPLIKGPIVDMKLFRDNMESLRAAAKIKQWPHNGLRHSFGSYHLAFHGDAVKTATQMGHRDSAIIHNHYKALVLKTDAEKFWSLRP